MLLQGQGKHDDVQLRDRENQQLGILHLPFRFESQHTSAVKKRNSNVRQH